MQKINFQNLPSTATPVNATNLNALQDNVEDVFDGDVPMGNIVVDSIRSKNMFDVLTCISGGINNSTGQPEAFDMATITNKNANNGLITFETSTEWKGIISEYIEVEENKTYTISFTTTENNMLYTAWFYDDNKNYLSNYAFTPGVSITMPSNAKYVRFLLETTNTTTLPATITLTNIQLEIGSTATSYSPYQELDNQENYSTSETVVGKWINGNNIYRQAQQISKSSSGLITLLSIPNLDVIVNISTYLKRDDLSGVYKNINNWGHVSSDYGIAFVEGNDIKFDSPYTGTLYIMIEYTKTTD